MLLSVLSHVWQRRLGQQRSDELLCGPRTCSICTVVRSDMPLIADSLFFTIRAARPWHVVSMAQ